MMERLRRLARLADQCEATGQSAREAVERDALRDAGRRRFAQGAVAAGAVAAAGAMAPLAIAGPTKVRRVLSSLGGAGGVAVVGAGIAGLSCAYELGRNGINAKVFEASSRVGGRCYSLSGYFPGQVVERGAEFINASHHTMLGYARMFGLQLEDASIAPGATYFHFDGRTRGEADLVEEYRSLAAAMRADLATVAHPTADRHSEADALYDFMSLDDYLGLQGTGSGLRKVIASAYAAEYGAGLDELSALSFLRFVHGDKRGTFSPAAAPGEGHFRVADGNDRIPTAIAQRLTTPVQHGHRLVAMRKLANGRVRLSFDVGGGRAVQGDYDAVVLAMPFSVLRDVHLDDNLGFPAWKRFAINGSRMGDNSKLLVGFNAPYWYLQHGASGSGFSDRARLQATWEANPGRSKTTQAVLASHVGGALARTLDPRTVQSDAQAFLSDLESALPGAFDAVRRKEDGSVLAFATNWSTNPYSKGSHPSLRPGYFTTMAHNEAKAVGNVLFAGDHTSSFYEWQGTMEGAALSGLRAASETVSLMQGKPVAFARAASGVR